MTNRKIIEHWLNKNRAFLNYQPIEQKAKLTKGTLHHFFEYGTPLSDSTIDALKKWMNQYIMSYSDSKL